MLFDKYLLKLFTPETNDAIDDAIETMRKIVKDAKILAELKKIKIPSQSAIQIWIIKLS